MGVHLPTTIILSILILGSKRLAGGVAVHTFTIENTGTADLTLSGTPKVEIDGANAGDFSVTAQPSSPVAANGTTTFVVKFDPSGTGTRSATLSIANNDSDEALYDFVIQGEGTGSDLASHWTFDDAGDLGENESTIYDMTISGGMTWTGNSKVGAGAVLLDGTAGGSAFATHILGDLTLSGWVNASALPASGESISLVGEYRGAVPENFNTFYDLALNDAGKLVYRHQYGPGGTYETLTFNSPILPVLNTGTWYHAAITRDSVDKEVTLYVNGSPVETKSYTHNPGGSGITGPQIYIGNTAGGGGCAERHFG